jgi:hypothetical protein
MRGFPEEKVRSSRRSTVSVVGVGYECRSSVPIVSADRRHRRLLGGTSDINLTPEIGHSDINFSIRVYFRP